MSKELITDRAPSEGIARALMDRGARYVGYRCQWYGLDTVRIVDLAKPLAYRVEHGRPVHPYETVCDCYDEKIAVNLLNLLNSEYRLGKE